MTETQCGSKGKICMIGMTGIAEQYFTVGQTTKRAQHTMLLTYVKNTNRKKGPRRGGKI